jgi:hypothetical protein
MKATLSVLAICVSISGCTHLLDKSHDGTATVENITSDPDAWEDKTVTVEGVLVFGDIESRLYADRASAKEGWAYDPAGLGIRMSDVRRDVSPSFDGKTVQVTGNVSLSCVHAHRWAEDARSEGRDRNIIFWVSGFCHTSVGPHLTNATVSLVR